MTTRYYRITDVRVKEAWADYKTENYALDAQAAEFAAKFDGAHAVFAKDVHGRSFHGLRFDVRQPTDIWTVPNAKDGDVQRPRARISLPRGSTDKAARQAELDRVTSIFAEGKPTVSPSLNSVYEAIGTDWGNIMFGGGFRLSEHSGELYVATGLFLNAEEITGSAYIEATKAA